MGMVKSAMRMLGLEGVEAALVRSATPEPLPLAVPEPATI